MKSEVFSLARVRQLFRNAFFQSRRTLYYGLPIAALTIGLIIPSLSNKTSHLLFVLAVFGLFYTVWVFSEIHDPHKAYQYFLLPVSNVERFLFKWMQTSIGFALFIILVLYASSWVHVISNSLFFHRSVPPLDLFATQLWLAVLKYIVLQSVFLVGAVYFKRHAVLKTALAIAVFIMLVNLMLFAVAYVSCPHCVFFIRWVEVISQTTPFLYYLFWVLLAPFCWVLSYTRLSECELR